MSNFRKNKLVSRVACLFVAFSFLSSAMMPGFARAQDLVLPQPTQFVQLSSSYSFPVLKGLRFDPNKPLEMEFIIDTADQKKIDQEEASALIRYFLAGLTIPESDLWVNMSPYEKDNMITQALSETDLGKDLLSQDYILKQISASLTYPETDTGKDYWAKTYQEIQRVANTTKVPVNTFNKIWIMPDKAVVYENGNLAVVAEASLKTMLEKDYLAFKNNQSNNQKIEAGLANKVDEASSKVMRELILPKINAEVNSGKNFATLRQIYSSLILATWFKKKFQESIYSYYIDKGKVKGIDLADKGAKDKIYNLYVEAFKKGVYNYVKSDFDPATRRNVKRQYFSGGMVMNITPQVTRASASAIDLTFSKGGPLARARIGLISETTSGSPLKEDTKTNEFSEKKRNNMFKFMKDRLESILLPGIILSSYVNNYKRNIISAELTEPEVLLLTKVTADYIKLSASDQVVSFNLETFKKLVQKTFQGIVEKNKTLATIRKEKLSAIQAIATEFVDNLNGILGATNSTQAKGEKAGLIAGVLRESVSYLVLAGSADSPIQNFDSTQHALRGLIQISDPSKEKEFDVLLKQMDIVGNQTEKKFETFIASVFDKTADSFKLQPVPIWVVNTILLFTDPVVTFNSHIPLEPNKAAINALTEIYLNLTEVEQIRLLAHIESLATGLKPWEGFSWVPKDYGKPYIIAQRLRSSAYEGKSGVNKIVFESSIAESPIHSITASDGTIYDIPEKFKGVEFGTSGHRGRRGEQVNKGVAAAITQGVSDFLNNSEEFKGKEKILILGGDPRPNNKEYLEEEARVAIANGFKVYAFEGIMPTPICSFVIRFADRIFKLGQNAVVVGGINNTPSHNPAHDDGIKFNPGGKYQGAPSHPEVNKYVQDRANEIINQGQGINRLPETESLSNNPNYIRADPEKVVSVYIERVSKMVDFNLIRRAVKEKGLKWPFNTQNGAGGWWARKIFSAIDKDLLISMNEDPKSDFGGLPLGPNTEKWEQLEPIMQPIIKNYNTPGAGATDGDADRFYFANENGESINFNIALALMQEYVTNVKGIKGAFKTCVDASSMFEKISPVLKREEIGFKAFQDDLKTEDIALAGEGGSGGLTVGKAMDPEGIGHILDKDGFIAQLVFLEMVSDAVLKDKTVSQLTENLFKKYGYYVSAKTSSIKIPSNDVDVVRKVKKESMKRLVDTYKKGSDFIGYTIKNIDTTDGLKLYLQSQQSPDIHTVLIRPSGTGAELRAYGEAYSLQSKAEATGTVDSIVKKRDALLTDLVAKVTAEISSASSIRGKSMMKETFDTLKNKYFDQKVADFYGLSLEEAQKVDPYWAKISFDGKENRLGWSMANLNWLFANPNTVQQIIADANLIRSKYKYVIFCGMGGSGLSVQVVKSTFGESGTRIYSLRTTDSAAIEDILIEIAMREGSNIAAALSKTLIIPISKSGRTQETVSHKEYFEKLFAKFSIPIKDHMWVITDKGSPFDTGEFTQREIQLNGKGDIGGRFTAPTTDIFLLPLAISDPMKVWNILKQAKSINEKDDTYLQLAAFLFDNAAHLGKDKVTMFVPDPLKDVPVWAEQLVEESLGKDGKGVTLFYGEKLSPQELRPLYENDRVFFRINLGGKKTQQELWEHLVSQGYPVYEINLDSIDDLGGFMLGLQRTVAAIAYLWDINFVDQPMVEGYKRETREAEKEIKTTGLKMPDAVNSAELNNLVFYYDPLIQAGILTKNDIEKEVKKLGADMNSAPAVYAAILNILKNKPNFEAKEMISYGRMTQSIRNTFEKARYEIFTKLFKMPAKLGEGPDKNHSFHQNIEGGKDMWLSLYFMPMKTNESDNFVTFGNDLIKAQTLGTVRSLVNAKRKVLLLTAKDSRENAEGDLAEFFNKATEYLKQAASSIEAKAQKGSVSSISEADEDDTSSSSPTGLQLAKGGIDLGNIDVNASPSSSPITLQLFDPNKFLGFAFKIIKIEPINNFALLNSTN